MTYYRNIYGYLSFPIGLLVFFLMAIVFFPCQTQGQNLKQVKQFIKNKEYDKALSILEKNNKTEKNPDFLIQRAICYYHTKQVDLCLSDLKKFEQFNMADPESWKYMGLSLLKKGRYLEASKILKKFLSVVNIDHPDYQMVIHEIRRCGKALQLTTQSQIAFVESAGNIINSAGMEIKPLYNPNFQERIYFSSNRPGSTGGKRDKNGLLNEKSGDFYTDMYYSDFLDGNWSKPTTFLPLNNTPKHDIIESFNGEGNIIYYAVSQDLVSSTFYSDTFLLDKNYQKLPSKVSLPFSGENGDKDLFFFNDSLLFFASMSLPGFGGYDLYYSQYTLGAWQSPVNLGPTVNSAFHDAAPYMTKGGNVLYFSSDRIEGLGGFDIFSVVFDTEKMAWQSVKNLGAPINSPWDEKYFIVSPDGINGVFTSDKPEGFGQSDIYLAYFKDQNIDQLLFAEIPEFLNPDSLKTNTLEIYAPKPIQKKEIRIKPVFYTNDQDVFSPSNLALLQSLYENMVIYPDTRLTMYCHSFLESSRDMDLYLSLKRVESVSDYFIKKGIEQDRIVIKACGSSFPLATPFINGIKSNIAEKNNKRIDFFLLPISSDIKVIREDPGLSGPFRDEKYDRFISAEDTLVFRILIAQSQQMFRSEVLNIYDDIYIEKSPDNEMNLYLLGNFQMYKDALVVKNELINQHQIKTKIIPYFKGIPMPRDLMLSLIKQLPELIPYLNTEE